MTLVARRTVSADEFDGGTAAVPGGVTGPVDRVRVVGAGIAGLTAARALTLAGVDCVVLEGRDRAGGRLHTIDLGESPADLGASWIHMPVGNPLRALASQKGIPCHEANPLPELAAYDLGLAGRLSAAELRASIALQYEAFPDAVAGLLTRLGPRASMADAIEAYVSETGLDPVAERRARQGLHAIIEAESADLSERQSQRWMWNELEYDGDYFGDVPAGGYQRIVDAMAAGTDVRLDWDVAAVELAAGAVRVRSADGRSEEGSHVVVTVPLGVLKRGAPVFSPALPAERLAAIARLGFGRYEKLVMRFDEPFWRAAGYPHLLIFPRDPREPAVWIFGLDGFAAGPVLSVQLFHSAAGRLLGEGGHDGASQEEVVRWALDMLGEVVGSDCPRPTAVAITSWAGDRFSRGSYSHIPPGASPADADLLGEPIDGRLLFAGEHTQSARLVYADGAMNSGIREAKRLLSQPRVRL
jgi:polyamine oxidase